MSRTTTMLLTAALVWPAAATPATAATRTSGPPDAAPASLPDLTVRRVSGPSYPFSPESHDFYLPRVVVNRGDAPSPQTRIRFLLSRDRVRSSRDPRVGGAPVPALDPGEVHRTDLPEEQLPRSTPVGEWFVLACVDPRHDVAESDETRSCTSSAAPIEVRLSDLRVHRLNLIDRQITPGEVLYLSFAVRNRGRAGNPASRLRVVLSSDQERSADDRYHAVARIPILHPGGGTNRQSVYHRLAEDTPPGTWWVIACVDPRDEVRESREQNQCRTSRHPVEVEAAARARG